MRIKSLRIWTANALFVTWLTAVVCGCDAFGTIFRVAFAAFGAVMLYQCLKVLETLWRQGNDDRGTR